MDQSVKSPRGKCPRCGKRIALRKTGRLRLHRGNAVSFGRSYCPDSLGLPMEGTVR